MAYKEPLHVKIGSFFSSVVMTLVGLAMLVACGFGGYILLQIAKTF